MDARGLGYVVITPKGGAPEYWVTFVLGPGWRAAYRVTYQGDGPARRARIEELRIVPKRSDPFHPRIAAGPPGTPFSFDAVRRWITARHLADALIAVGALLVPKDPEDPELPAPPPRVETSSPTRRGAGRPSKPRTFYAKLALDFDAVENRDGRKEPRTSTRDILAKKYDVPTTTIAKWIYTARQQGFLTPVVRGRRGGLATDEARNLLNRKPATRNRPHGSRRR